MNGTKARVHIDCGASHNFISQKLVDEVKLPLSSFEGCWVKMGDGYQVRSGRVCLVVQVQLHGAVNY